MRKVFAALLILLLSGTASAFESKADLRFDATVELYFVTVSFETFSRDTKQVEFVLDSGAARIVVPVGVLMGVEKTFMDTITLFLGGSHAVEATVFQVPRLTVGECEMRDVEVVATGAVSIPFLGGSFLRRAEPYTVGDGQLRFSCPAVPVAQVD